MKFPFPFKPAKITITTTSAASPWPWPACANNPRTLSFRATTSNDDIYKTINSAYLDDKNNEELFFSFEHYHGEIFSEISKPEQTDSVIESAVVRGLRSERLFFEPGETNSILEEAKLHECIKENCAMIMAIDSRDPFVDFRVSMEEMVEAHGMKDWEHLEDLLACYLRINGKNNHGYILGAFVDLLIGHLASNVDSNSSSAAIDGNCSSSSTNITQCSFTSPLSFSSSTYSSIENEDGIINQKNGDSSSSLSFSCNASSSSGV